MWSKRIQYLNENYTRIAKSDRVFLNNPVVMSGLGLTPLIATAYTAQNAVILSIAVLLILTPTRIAGSFCSKWIKLRALAYCLPACIIYIGVYLLLRNWFDLQLIAMGIYFPLLTVEPIIIKRYERNTPEKWTTALKKGLLTTSGYILVILIVGSLREFLAFGTIFGYEIASTPALPMASLTSGGFIVLALLCAFWRSLINMTKKWINMEAKKYQ